MKVWLIVMQGDDSTWVEDAWDDDSTAENHQGWEEAVEKARQTVRDNDYELRVIPVEIDGIHEAFDVPELQGRVVL
jgi:hypothetical protein